MAALVQHLPFDAALTEPETPAWLPAEDLPPEGWHLYRSGEFPTVTDKALIEEAEPDAH